MARRGTARSLTSAIVARRRLSGPRGSRHRGISCGSDIAARELSLWSLSVGAVARLARHVIGGRGRRRRDANQPRRPARLRGRDGVSHQFVRSLRQRLQLVEVQPLQLLPLCVEARLRANPERFADLALRDDSRIEAEQPCPRRSETHAQGHRGGRVPRLDQRPQARDHLVAALQLQRPKAPRHVHGRLAKGREFGRDVAVDRVHVHVELLCDVRVRAAGLAQFEGDRAPFGNRLDLAGSSARGAPLSARAVALRPAAVEAAAERVSRIGRRGTLTSSVGSERRRRRASRARSPSKPCTQLSILRGNTPIFRTEAWPRLAGMT